MMKMSFYIWIIFLIGIIIPITSVTAQNNKEDILLLLEKPIQTDKEVKSMLLPDSKTSFPVVYPELSTTNMFLLPYGNALKLNTILGDCNLSDTTKFLKHFSYIPFNEHKTYVGFGKYNNIGTSLFWVPTDKLSLEAKIYISKQFGYILASRHISVGTGLMLNYDITDRLRFRIGGQYLNSDNTDPFLNMNNLFPKTNIGVDLQYKTTEKMEVGVGLEYQYNNKTNTWKPESKGKVKIGF